MNMSCFALAVGLATLAPASRDSVPADPTTEFLEERWRQLEEPGPRLSTREFLNFVLEASAANWHPERVERALELVAQKQDRDPQSKTFGHLAWYWEDAQPSDLNATEFALERAVLTWMLHRDRLSPRAAELLQQLMTSAMEGAQRHKVTEDYTNIFLMKTWNCIAMGESTGDSALAQAGYRMLHQWLRRVRDAGIHEYLSPHYYAGDLECLGLIARHAQSSAARAKAALALEYLWTDIAANWFAPAARLGGAHSRDYDPLTGHGALDRWAARAGWTTIEEPVTTEAMEQAFVPPPEGLMQAIGATIPRIVRQRWGSAEGERAVNWIGRAVSLASSGATYLDATNKTLVLLFGGGARIVGAGYLMDARDDPYGQSPIPAGGGHLKAFHVQPFTTSVQNGLEVLLLATASAGWRTSDPSEGQTPAFKHSGTDLTCWLSHFIFPAEIQVYVGATGAAVEVKDRLRLPAPDAPVFLRYGRAAAALRFVYATAPDGAAAPVELVNDGAAWKAMRLTAVHAERRPQGRATAVLWVRAAENLGDAGFAALRRAFAAATPRVKLAGTVLDAQVPGQAGTLRLVVDLQAEKALAIEGAAPEPEDLVLEVNGRELGAPLLDRALAIRFRP
jgi:hypothetical protein